MRSKFPVRLNANRDDIGSNDGRNAGEQCLWRWFAVYADLRQISCKTLPGPDVERNSSPTPVVNVKLQRRVSFGHGTGIHAWLLPIARYPFPVNRTRTVLPASCDSCYIPDTHRPNGSKYLHLLFTDRVRIKRYRRLHRSQRQQLKQMVSHHIAQGARLFIERRAVFDSHRFSSGDLHILDVVPVPHRFEQRVAEAEDEDVLYRLFAKIVVNSVDRFFVEYAAHNIVQRMRRFQVPPELLFQNNSRPPMVA